MKKRAVFLTSLMLVAGCNGTGSGLDLSRQDNTEAEVQTLPRHISGQELGDGENYVIFDYEFTGNPDDFVAEGYSDLRRWTGLNDNRDAGPYAKLLRIDDDETLRKHYRPDYDPLDWSQKTLLLAYGMRSYLDYPVTVRFDGQGDNNFLLSVGIQRSGLCALLWWRVAILVDKLDTDAAIEVATSDYTVTD